MHAQRESTKSQDLEHLRSNPANWAWYGGYRCAADPRLIVRDRHGLGWALNEDHPRANLVKAAILVLVAAMLVAIGVVVR